MATRHSLNTDYGHLYQPTEPAPTRRSRLRRCLATECAACRTLLHLVVLFNVLMITLLTAFALVWQRLRVSIPLHVYVDVAHFNVSLHLVE